MFSKIEFMPIAIHTFHYAKDLFLSNAITSILKKVSVALSGLNSLPYDISKGCAVTQSPNKLTKIHHNSYFILDFFYRFVSQYLAIFYYWLSNPDYTVRKKTVYLYRYGSSSTRMNRLNWIGFICLHPMEGVDGVLYRIDLFGSVVCIFILHQVDVPNILVLYSRAERRLTNVRTLYNNDVMNIV